MRFEIWDLFKEGAIVVKGLPGVGKTLLVAKAASQFKKVAWFTFYETADRLVKFLKSAGLTPPAYIFDLVSVEPRVAVKIIVDKVLELNPDFVVVDGVSALTAEGERELIHAVFYHGLSRERPIVLVKEGVETTPSDYIADTIIEVEHRIFNTGASARYVKILKSRGYYIPQTVFLYALEERPTVVAPGREPVEITAEKISTGFPELDQVLEGGLLRGSLAALVGPPDGLASKLAVLMAAELAKRNYKVLYHHHKLVPLYIETAKRFGASLKELGVSLLYHPVSEHMSANWWYRSAVFVNQGKYDLHIVDQYEEVLLATGIQLLKETIPLHRSLLKYPTVIFHVFNSYSAWREMARYLSSYYDYILLVKHNHAIIHTPDNITPIKLQFRVDLQERRVVFKL